MQRSERGLHQTARNRRDDGYSAKRPVRCIAAALRLHRGCTEAALGWHRGCTSSPFWRSISALVIAFPEVASGQGRMAQTSQRRGEVSWSYHAGIPKCQRQPIRGTGNIPGLAESG